MKVRKFFRNILSPLIRFWKRKYLFPKQKKRVEEILTTLCFPVTLENFLDDFHNDFSRLRTVEAVKSAVETGVLSWQEVGGTNDGTLLEEVYVEHLSQLVAIYSASFFNGYWKTYEQTKAGYQSFLGISLWNRLPPESAEPIKKKFSARLYWLLRKEMPFSPEQAIFDRLSRQCGISEEYLKPYIEKPLDYLKSFSESEKA